MRGSPRNSAKAQRQAYAGGVAGRAGFPHPPLGGGRRQNSKKKGRKRGLWIDKKAVLPAISLRWTFGHCLWAASSAEARL